MVGDVPVDSEESMVISSILRICRFNLSDMLIEKVAYERTVTH
jgi:hypothetical protein